MSHLKDLLNDFKGRKVLVVGDVMLDSYLSGHVNRISPEAPVPVLEYQSTHTCLGGAANVALNLKGLGAEVYLAGMIGKDSEGATIRRLLDTKSIDGSCVIDSERVTTSKTRVMSSDQHLLRVDREERHALSDVERIDLFSSLDRLMRKVSIEMVILQDYNKGVLTQQSIQMLLALCKEKGIQTCVDPKFDNFYTYQGVDIFKPNLLELRTSLPFDVGLNATDLGRAAGYLRGKLECKIVMITLSDKGIYLNTEGEAHMLPVPKKSIVDVCGAGDTVISMASLTYLVGSGFRDVAYWSSFAGTLTCQHPGVVPITAEMLLAEDH
ncbi:MAG: hypothetical protein HKN87_10600 [Saprospiraceae bacterium]|nr:hypothetical protein [Saprospiraceae bacterium]